jgi:hypothetical protein
MCRNNHTSQEKTLGLHCRFTAGAMNSSPEHTCTMSHLMSPFLKDLMLKEPSLRLTRSHLWLSLLLSQSHKCILVQGAAPSWSTHILLLEKSDRIMIWVPARLLGSSAC